MSADFVSIYDYAFGKKSTYEYKNEKGKKVVEKVTFDLLAEAIENEIYRLDEFDRAKIADATQVEFIMSSLKKFPRYDHQKGPQDQDDYIIYIEESNQANEWFEFGWPPKRLPQFPDLRKSLNDCPSPQHSVWKIAGAAMRIVIKEQLKKSPDEFIAEILDSNKNSTNTMVLLKELTDGGLKIDETTFRAQLKKIKW